MNRWILPTIGALGVHVALFTAMPEWQAPAVLMPESRTVSISLVQLPAPQKPAPAPQKIAPPPPPKKAAPKIKKKVPRPLPKPPPLPEPVAPEPIEPEPAPEEPESEMIPETVPEKPPAPETETAAVAKPAEAPLNAPMGPDQAQVQASVPLYHLNPPPAYPAVARRRNYQGTVILDVLVDRRGRAADIRVAESSGFPILDRSAVKSVTQWRFEPARRFGRTVEMWVQVPVRFELK